MAYKSQVTITRPNNTDAYIAGDIVGNSTSAGGGVLTFSNIGSLAGDSFITSTSLRIHVAGVPAGMTSFRLHLYDVTPPSALADNAPWDLPAGDRASYLGYIDLGSPADVGSTLFVQADQVNKQVRLRNDYTLYGYLVTIAGYTPSAQAVKVIELHAVAA
jgi:hypothetical protein